MENALQFCIFHKFIKFWESLEDIIVGEEHYSTGEFAGLGGEAGLGSPLQLPGGACTWCALPKVSYSLEDSNGFI